MISIRRFLTTLFLYSLMSLPGYADNAVVDKVYHPYVMPNEQEFEWRFVSRELGDRNVLTQRVGYGYAVREDLSIEVYLIGERDNEDNFGLQAYEVEARWMLTEQGQYWADWGLLFELEKEHQKDNWEFSTALLFEKEIGRTSLTVNLFAEYEWGNSISNEFESEVRINYRYRWKSAFQPAIELYSGKGIFGIGPAIMGLYRYEKQKQLKWELGFITGLNGNDKNHSLRFALEWEF